MENVDSTYKKSERIVLNIIPGPSSRIIITGNAQASPSRQKAAINKLPASIIKM